MNFLKKLFNLNPEKDNIVLVSSVDTSQARKEAQEAIGLFEKLFSEHRDDKSYFFSLKKRFVDGEDGEYLWVDVTDHDKGIFEGRINNIPVLVNNVEYGDRVSVSLEDVEDWQVKCDSKGVAFGGFLRPSKVG